MFSPSICLINKFPSKGIETLIALLGFTYSLSGDGALFITSGQVGVARLDFYYPGPKNVTKPKVDDFANEQYLAHLFGERKFILTIGHILVL